MTSPTEFPEGQSRNDPGLFASQVPAPGVPESEVPPNVIRTLETSWENLAGDDDQAEQTEQIQVSRAAETKSLYREGRRDSWHEWNPEDHSFDPHLHNPSAKVSLIVRHQKQHSDTDRPLFALDSITVQSPIIRKQLGPVFAGYKGINTNLKKLEFCAPFREFFYRWKEFLQAKPTEDKGEELTHYKLLFDIISAEISPHIDQASDLLKNEVISYDYLWTIFEPGTEVYTELDGHDGHDRLLILDSGKYETLRKGNCYNLLCRYIDTDGSSFGYQVTSLMIWEFDDLKPILELKGVHHRSYMGHYQLAHPAPGAPYKQCISGPLLILSFERSSELLMHQ